MQSYIRKDVSKIYIPTILITFLNLCENENNHILWDEGSSVSYLLITTNIDNNEQDRLNKIILKKLKNQLYKIKMTYNLGQTKIEKKSISMRQRLMFAFFFG